MSVVRRIRAESHLPVLMLTARGNEMDRIIGLEIGVDDPDGEKESPTLIFHWPEKCMEKLLQNLLVIVTVILFSTLIGLLSYLLYLLVTISQALLTSNLSI